MTNMFGEEVQPRKLTTEWVFPRLLIYIDESYHGCIHPNGIHGDMMNLNHRLGEPVLENLHIWSSLSFSEMSQLMQEYYKHMPNKRAFELCVTAVAEKKKLSYIDALNYLKEKNVPLIDV